MTEIFLLTPSSLGPEMAEISENRGARALLGTGFNPDNPQHYLGSDAVRYAIALQQLREAGDLEALDIARSLVEQQHFLVMQEREATRVMAAPTGYRGASKKRRAEMRKTMRMVIHDGILYDHL